MITYKLAKRLKDAGFPQNCDHDSMMNAMSEIEGIVHYPTLSELIEACGEEFGHLVLNVRSSGERIWLATASVKIAGGVGKELARVSGYNTPEEAVALLWIKLNEK